MVAGKLAQFSNDRFLGMGTRNFIETNHKGSNYCYKKKIAFIDKRIFGKQTTIIEGKKFF